MPRKSRQLTIRKLHAIVAAIKCQSIDWCTPIDLTIGSSYDRTEWGYQTGDNSYYGDAYGLPCWGLATIDKSANCLQIARDLFTQIRTESEEYNFTRRLALARSVTA